MQFPLSHALKAAWAVKIAALIRLSFQILRDVWGDREWCTKWKESQSIQLRKFWSGLQNRNFKIEYQKHDRAIHQNSHCPMPAFLVPPSPCIPCLLPILSEKPKWRNLAWKYTHDISTTEKRSDFQWWPAINWTSKSDSSTPRYLNIVLVRASNPKSSEKSKRKIRK